MTREVFNEKGGMSRTKAFQGVVGGKPGWLGAFGGLDRGMAYRLSATNPSIDIATPEDVIDVGGSYPFPAAAEILDITSDHVQDILTGDGARSYEVKGLDANHLEIEETISAAVIALGTVQTQLAYLRVREFNVVTVGSSGFNEGTVTLTNQTAQVLATINPQISKANISVFTVAADRQGFVGFHKNIFSQGIGKVEIRTVDPNGVVKIVDTFLPDQIEYVDVPAIIEEKTDVSMRATVSIDATQVYVTSTFYEV